MLKRENNKIQKIKGKYGRKKEWKRIHEKEWKNKEHVCYPPLDFSKESIMNLCRYGKQRRMKWVIK